MIEATGQAAPESGDYTRRNALGIAFEYSNDPLHFHEEPEQRKLASLGISYSHRIRAGRIVNWQYDAEFYPLAFESDPLSRTVIVYTSPSPVSFGFPGPPLLTCAPEVSSFSYTIDGVTYAGSTATTCAGRQWTMGQALAPLGMQWNFRPLTRWQPLAAIRGGYMYSTRPIPLSDSGSFNFTLDVAAGLEYFRTHSQSIRVEYRFHHISNGDSARSNPGIDSGVFHVGYVFGR